MDLISIFKISWLQSINKSVLLNLFQNTKFARYEDKRCSHFKIMHIKTDLSRALGRRVKLNEWFHLSLLHFLNITVDNNFFKHRNV